ncbi:MAG: penicillin-binding protein 2 [Bacillota bacterium]
MRDLQNRVLILLGVITVALLLLGLQLYRLTVAESAAWASRAMTQTQRELPSHGPRGAIYDRSGRLMATSEPVFAAMLIEQEWAHVERILPRLSLLLADGDVARAERIRENVREKVLEHVSGGRQYEDLIIESHLSQSAVATFMEQRSEFPGVTLVTQSARRYPFGTVASQVLGYVGAISASELESPEFNGYFPDAWVGKDGLELSYEKQLQGKPGTRRKLVDPTGRPVGMTQETPAEPGNNLVLTLDLELQKVAEQALLERMAWVNANRDEEANPIRGALVAIEVKTGAVLAMASVPTFDPNLFVKRGGMTTEEYNKYINIPEAPLVNWAISGFAPGSTYKMGVGLAGVQLGELKLNETVHCSKTYERDPTRANWYPFDQGFLALDMALAQSCNPYFYEAGYRVGIDRLAEFLAQFGFGQRTGIDLPYEDKGVNPTKASYGDRWQPGHVFSVGIGQGDVKVTPLQLAVYTATIANSGVRYQPFLVSEIRSPSGQLIERHEPVQAGVVQAAPEHWKRVQEGMRKGVTHPLGTAYTPFLGFPVPVAAKTGSAETGLGYANALTVAYAPYDDPQIAVAVIVEGGAHGSWVSPAARAVFAHYFGIQEKTGDQKLEKAD